MYDRILVPTDGSPAAEAANDVAVALARAHGVEIHVLHVIDARYYDTARESALDPLREEGKRYVDRLAAVAADAGVDATVAVETGRPARRVLDYVAEHDVDLVVMSTRGRGGLPRRVLGSVTNYVVTHADVPVHVVPVAESGAER